MFRWFCLNARAPLALLTVATACTGDSPFVVATTHDAADELSYYDAYVSPDAGNASDATQGADARIFDGVSFDSATPDAAQAHNDSASPEIDGASLDSGAFDAAQAEAGSVSSKVDSAPPQTDEHDASGPASDAAVPSCRIPHRCANEVKDGDETDIDCGGSCLACATLKHCSSNIDCQTNNRCVASTCVDYPIHCRNAAKDGDESDLNCGGSCAPCILPRSTCSSNQDCDIGRCIAGPPRICEPVAAIQLSVIGHGAVIAPNPAGGPAIVCTDTCTIEYPSGSSVTITAESASGFGFGGWFRGDCGTAPPGTVYCTVTLPVPDLLHGGSEVLGVAAYFTDLATEATQSTGGIQGASPSSVDIDGSNVAVIAGTFFNPSNFGLGGVYTPTNDDGFVVTLNASTDPAWVRTVGGSGYGYDTVSRALIGQDAQVNMLGGIEGSVSVGGSALTCPPPERNAINSPILASYNLANGSHRWSRCISGRSNTIALDSNGDILVFGELTMTVDLGGGTITVPNGESRLYLAKYSRMDGSYLWHKVFPSGDIKPNFPATLFVAYAPNGDIVLGATVGASIDLGNGPLTFPAPYTLLLARVNPHGDVLFSRVFPSTADGGFSLQALTVSSTDDIVLAAAFSYQGRIDLDCAALDVSNFGSWIIAKLSGETGVVEWVRTYHEPIVLDTRNEIVVAGEVSDRDDIGILMKRNVVGQAMFVAKLTLDGDYLWQKLLPAAQANAIKISTSGDVLIANSAGALIRLGP
jgi:hypothetical protein